MISEIRDKVYRLIAENKDQEVLRNSDHHSAGVYMLYVDNFESDTIIPFYIGQTNNFQDRHKQHLSELMALNRLQHNCYEHAVIKDLYNLNEIIEIEKNKNFAQSSMVTKAFDKIINQGWLHFENIERGLNDEN